jgi:hypothetical protein
MAAVLTERPAGETPAEALRATVLACLDEAERLAVLTTRLTALLNNTPIARALLWDVTTAERLALINALASRTGRATDDPAVVLAAYTAGAIIEVALRDWGEAPQHPQPTVTARRYLDALAAGGNPLANLDPRPGA